MDASLPQPVPEFSRDPSPNSYAEPSSPETTYPQATPFYDDMIDPFLKYGDFGSMSIVEGFERQASDASASVDNMYKGDYWFPAVES